MDDAKLTDERGRLAALNRANILDTPPEEPFERITSLLKSVLGVPMTAITLLDADRQWMKSRCGLDADHTARDISFCTHTIEGRDPFVVPDASRDPRFAANPLVTDAPRIAAYAGVPLETVDGYNLGALCAIDTKPREFAAHELDLLKSFARLVIGEIQLRQIADRDHLTGAFCRRAALEEMERAVARHARHGTPAALIMFDIDHFKSINDRYGHPGGDSALRAVSARIAAMLRPDDVLGRLGGEEFAILLNGTGLDDATVAAERFRAALAAMIVPNDPPLRLTASFGIAVLGPDIADVDAWLAAADGALYAAKNSGRNRCRTAHSGGRDDAAAA
nr:sensor domain-containing diguanylate cyclase [Sphingomonas sanxanigenens]